MKKFFLFRKEEINASSVTASDSGQGLSVLALPADSLAFASAGKGHIVLSFNGATKYEESNLTDGESLEKTSVKIPCEIGKEVDLIESILAFISREGGKSMMKFDAVDESSTFSPVSYDSKIESKVHINPTKRVTGEASTQSFIGSTGTVGADVVSTTIAGIDFGIAENKPIVDYNHTDLDGMSVGDELGHGGGSHHWDNAGTGGITYDIISNVGEPTVSDVTDYLSKRSASLDGSDHFIVPTLTVQNDYTLYVAYQSKYAHAIYSDGDGECFGPTIGQTVADNGAITKMRSGSLGRFVTRHHDRFGAFPNTDVNNEENGTVSYIYPLTDVEEPQLFQVFVIRRDFESNLYMYNKDGDLVGFIPALDTSSIIHSKPTTATDYRTDGDLKIERLGTVADIAAGTAFVGRIARFGVIERDIGSASCSKLATDLNNLYKV
jgi:hypothetical protein